MITLPTVLPKPKLPLSLPSTAKWLAGEGAGSWFVIEKDKDNHYKISRYSPVGNLECESIFKTERVIDLHEDFTITYPSHCSVVTIFQGNEKIRFMQSQPSK